MAKKQNFLLQVHHVKPLGMEAKCWFTFCLPLLDTSKDQWWKSAHVQSENSWKRKSPRSLFAFPPSFSFTFTFTNPFTPNVDSKGPHGLEAWHQHSQDGTTATQVNHLWPNPCVKAASASGKSSSFGVCCRRNSRHLWLNTSGIYRTYILIYGM